MNDSKLLFIDLTPIVHWTKISDFYKGLLRDSQSPCILRTVHSYQRFEDGIVCHKCGHWLLTNDTKMPRSRSDFINSLLKEIESLSPPDKIWKPIYHDGYTVIGYGALFEHSYNEKTKTVVLTYGTRANGKTSR